MNRDDYPINRMVENWSKAQLERLGLLDEFNVQVLANGKPRITYFENGAPRPCDYEDILAAIRAQDHIIEGYLSKEFRLGETAIIREIEKTVNKTRDLCLIWRLVSEAEVYSMDKQIKSAEALLTLSRNQFKVATHDQLLAMAGFMDKTGQLNPGATAARATASLDRLQKRQTQINENAIFSAQRKLVLLNEKEQMKLNLISALTKTKYLHDYFEDLVTSLKEHLYRLINEIQYSLSSVWLSPYSSNSRKVKKMLLLHKIFKYPRPKIIISESAKLIEQALISKGD